MSAYFILGIIIFIIKIVIDCLPSRTPLENSELLLQDRLNGKSVAECEELRKRGRYINH